MKAMIKRFFDWLDSDGDWKWLNRFFNWLDEK